MLAVQAIFKDLFRILNSYSFFRNHDSGCVESLTSRVQRNDEYNFSKHAPRPMGLEPLTTCVQRNDGCSLLMASSFTPFIHARLFFYFCSQLHIFSSNFDFSANTYLFPRKKHICFFIFPLSIQNFFSIYFVYVASHVRKGHIIQIR